MRVKNVNFIKINRPFGIPYADLGMVEINFYIAIYREKPQLPDTFDEIKDIVLAKVITF